MSITHIVIAKYNSRIKFITINVTFLLKKKSNDTFSKKKIR